MAIEVIVIGALAMLAAFALATHAPRIAFGLHFGRKVVWGIVAIITAMILIATNVTSAMVIGAIILFFVALAILIEDPEEEVW